VERSGPKKRNIPYIYIQNQPVPKKLVEPSGSCFPSVAPFLTASSRAPSQHHLHSPVQWSSACASPGPCPCAASCPCPACSVTNMWVLLTVLNGLRHESSHIISTKQKTRAAPFLLINTKWRHSFMRIRLCSPILVEPNTT
jgi:hypothetical protein